VSAHEHTDDAAAYVLGALEPAEAQAFRRHLSECVVCRDEVTAFTEALPAAAPQHHAPAELRRRVLDAVREDARQRQTESQTDPQPKPSRRFRLPTVHLTPAAALASAAVIALAALAGVELTGGSGGSRAIAASVGDAQVRVSGTHAELVVRHLPAPPAGGIYELWVRRGSRPPEPTNTLFSVNRSGTADVGVPGGVNGVSAVMVTAEPAGGTRTPTTTPVIVAQLS
jgi:anti-sigma factor RsiW